MRLKVGVGPFLVFFSPLIAAVITFTGCSLLAPTPQAVPLASLSNNALELARSYRRDYQDALEKAYQEYRQALENADTRDQASLELGILLYESGRFEDAIYYLDGLEGDSQDDFLLTKALGLCHFRLHAYGEAMRHLNRAKELNAKDGETLYVLGLVYEDANCAEEAKESFRGAIDTSPDTPWFEKAKAHLDRLQTADAGLLSSQIEDKEVRDLVLKAPAQKEYPDAGAIVLLDQEKLTIHRNMTQTREIHQVVKILNDRGKDRAEVEIHYDSLYESVRVDVARTIKPDATIVKVGSEAMRDLTPWGGFPLYSNAKVRVISMPEVVEGSIIEHRATVFSSRLPYGKYFDNSFGFQDWEPIMVSRFILEIPQNLLFKTHFIHTEPIQPRIERIGENPASGILRYTWERKDVPAIKWESDMPGWADIAPMILVSSFPDWKAFNQWWWKLAEDKIKADEAIKQKVMELTEAQSTTDDKARAIYHYVASKIRYVGLEYGEGGFRPHHASEVFANKYGDCKDQAILLVTMLREAGIHAHPVLIGTRGGLWDLQQSIPMSQFDHCIALAEIDGRNVWLDPTDETCPYGELPGHDQDRGTLVFFQDRARSLRTPLLSPERNRTIREIQVRIDAAGGARVRGKTTYTGEAGQWNRYYYKLYSPEERTRELRDEISRFFPGAVIESYTFSALDDLNVPVTVQLEFTVPEYAKNAGNLLLSRLPRFLYPVESVGNENRTHPVVWDATKSIETKLTIQIPEGYRVRYLPEDCEINLPFASYKHQWANRVGTIRFLALKERPTRRTEVDQYPKYRTFEERIAKECDKLIILETMETRSDFASTTGHEPK